MKPAFRFQQNLLGIIEPAFYIPVEVIEILRIKEKWAGKRNARRYRLAWKELLWTDVLEITVKY